MISWGNPDVHIRVQKHQNAERIFLILLLSFINPATFIPPARREASERARMCLVH